MKKKEGDLEFELSREQGMRSRSTGLVIQVDPEGRLMVNGVSTGHMVPVGERLMVSVTDGVVRVQVVEP